MDGWMDGFYQTDGWMDGFYQTDGWMDGWILSDGWMDGWMDVLMDDGLMDGSLSHSAVWLFSDCDLFCIPA